MKDTWMFFLKHKADAASAFRSFLASVRVDGKPSLVEIVGSDNGGEFFRGEFESLCNELLISSRSSLRLIVHNTKVLRREA